MTLLKLVLINNPDFNFEGTGIRQINFCAPLPEGWEISEGGTLYFPMENVKTKLSALLQSTLLQLKRDYSFKERRNQSLKEVTAILREKGLSNGPLILMGTRRSIFKEQHEFLEKIKGFLLDHPNLTFENTGLSHLRFWKNYPLPWEIIGGNTLYLPESDTKTLSTSLYAALKELRDNFSYRSPKEQAFKEVIDLMRQKNYQGTLQFTSIYKGTYRDQYNFLKKIILILNTYPDISFQESTITKIKLWSNSPRDWSLESGTLNLNSSIGEKELAQALQTTVNPGLWQKIWGYFSD